MNPYEPPQIEPPKVPDFKWSRVIVALILVWLGLLILGSFLANLAIQLSR